MATVLSLVPLTGRRHELKSDPAVYDAVVAGLKTFEIRRDDRGFEVGDELVLRRTRHAGADMRSGAPLAYTGEYCVRLITHILRGPKYDLPADLVVMSIVEASPESASA